MHKCVCTAVTHESFNKHELSTGEAGNADRPGDCVCCSSSRAHMAHEFINGCIWKIAVLAVYYAKVFQLSYDISVRLLGCQSLLLKRLLVSIIIQIDVSGFWPFHNICSLGLQARPTAVALVAWASHIGATLTLSDQQSEMSESLRINLHQVQ